MLNYDRYTIGPDKTLELSYTDNGPKCVIKNTKSGGEISIILPWEKLTCFRYPKHCEACPVGFSCNTEKGIFCGRNVPWTAIDRIQRPSTCQLKLFDIFEFINMI